MAENQSYAEQNKARLKDITDSIEAGIKDLFQSDKYKQYLSTMSRFHRYSVNNTMLIYMQKPDATVCAGFNKWRDQFERNVMKGERGIKIIAPTPYKKKIEQEKLDPDIKLPISVCPATMGIRRNPTALQGSATFCVTFSQSILSFGNTPSGWMTDGAARPCLILLKGGLPYESCHLFATVK